MLEAGLSFHKLGEVDVCIDEVVAEATGFIAACYGSKERNSMSDVRKDVWATETVTTMPDLKVLPLNKNIQCTHIQPAIGKLDPTKYGWACDEVSRLLILRDDCEV